MRPLSPQVQATLTVALSLVAALLLTLLASSAYAHTGADGGAHHSLLESFLQGFTHPFTGLDHLAAMAGVGLWTALAAQQLDHRLWLAPLSFSVMLGVGALLGFAGIGLMAVEPMIAASVLLVGLLAAVRMELPNSAAAALVGMFAVFHGVAHGLEMAALDGSLLVLAGMTLATLLLHGAGMGVGVLLRQKSVWWPRLLGAGIAAFGASLLLA
ncbi:MAG: HupE/UreJ family protein [Burkholderiales bacterium]